MPRTFYASPAPGCIHPRNPQVRLDTIVIHTMEGSFQGTISWFQNPDRKVLTCVHYLVSKEGDVCQMVPDHKKCYHAGFYNDRSIGIELEGRADESANLPAAELDAAAKVVAVLCLKYRIPIDRYHIIGHNEVPGATHYDPGNGFPWDEFMERVRSWARRV